MRFLPKVFLALGVFVVAGCSQGGPVFDLGGTPAGNPAGNNPTGSPTGSILPLPLISNSLTLPGTSGNFSSSSNFRSFGTMAFHSGGVSSSESYRLVHPSLSTGEQKLGQSSRQSGGSQP